MDRIILIAQQISQEGKVPNTALIKARLPKNVPLPTIIQGLKMWQQNPQKIINESTITPLNSAKEKPTSSEFDALIELKISQAIAPLQAQINELKLALQQLKTEDRN